MPRLPGVGARAAHANASGPFPRVEPYHRRAISTNSGVSSFTGNNGELPGGRTGLSRARHGTRASCAPNRGPFTCSEWLLSYMYSESGLRSSRCLAVAALITAGIWPCPLAALLRDHFL